MFNYLFIYFIYFFQSSPKKKFSIERKYSKVFKNNRNLRLYFEEMQNYLWRGFSFLEYFRSAMRLIENFSQKLCTSCNALARFYQRPITISMWLRSEREVEKRLRCFHLDAAAPWQHSHPPSPTKLTPSLGGSNRANRIDEKLHGKLQDRRKRKSWGWWTLSSLAVCRCWCFF